MKKKLTVFIGIIFCLSMLAGCGSKITPEQSYFDKSLAMMAWPGVTDTSTIDFSVELAEFPIPIDYSITMVSEQVSATMLAKATISAVSNSEFLPDIENLTLYVDGTKIYIETAAVKNICEAFLGEVPAELAAITQEYLMYDSGETAEMSMDDMSPAMAAFYQSMLDDPMAFSTEFGNKFFAAYPDFSIGLQQKGNQFTLKLNNGNIIAVADKVILGMISNAKALVEIVPLTEEEKAEVNVMLADTAALKKQYEQQRDAFKPMIQAQLDAGTFSLEADTTMNDADYISKCILTADYDMFGKISMTINSKGAKASDIEIKAPTSFVDINSLSFIEDMMYSGYDDDYDYYDYDDYEYLYY